jgi:hypothetical protein
MATPDINFKESCAICNMRFSMNSIKLFCNVCKQNVHVKCNGNNDVTNQHKYCSRCLIDIFPFNHIEDEVAFKNCLFDLRYGANIVLRNVEQFKICSDYCITNHDGIDPDSQFYSAQTTSNCNYYLPEEFNKLCVSLPHTSFSVLHVNARSLNKNLDNLTSLLFTCNYPFTAIAISETWATELNMSYLNIPGYFSSGKQRPSRGGGTLIYIRENTPFIDRTDLDIYSNDSTCQSVFIELTGMKQKTIIGCIYRAPGNDLDIFNDKFDVLLQKLNNERAYCLIAGDYNINLLNYDNHSQTTDFVEHVFAQSFIPLITRPTHFTADKSTLIDNIIANSANRNSISGILLSDVSDHLPVFHILHENIVNNDITVMKKLSRVINENNVNRLCSQLSSENWNFVYGCNDVNDCFGMFHDRFLDLYNHNLPAKRSKTKIKTIYKPWITPGIIKSIKKKHKLYKQSLTSKTAIAVSKYKRYNNKLNKIIKYSQRDYYINRFESIKKNIKLTWCEIKDIINERKNIMAINEIDANGTSIKDPKSIANKFNEYFVSIGPTLANKIEPLTDNPTKYIKPVKNSMFLQPCDEAEIINIVKLLSSNKAAGFDDISPSVIKSIIALFNL